jgi:hypothetical protein
MAVENVDARLLISKGRRKQRFGNHLPLFPSSAETITPFDLLK